MEKVYDHVFINCGLSLMLYQGTRRKAEADMQKKLLQMCAS